MGAENMQQDVIAGNKRDGVGIDVYFTENIDIINAIDGKNFCTNILFYNYNITMFLDNTFYISYRFRRGKGHFFRFFHWQ